MAIKLKVFYNKYLKTSMFKEEKIEARKQLCDFLNKNKVKVIAITENASYGNALKVTLYYDDAILGTDVGGSE